MKKPNITLLLVALVATGCGSSDPGASVPPAKPVTQADVDKMTPEQKAGYEQAMKSMNGARSIHNQPPAGTTGG